MIMGTLFLKTGREPSMVGRLFRNNFSVFVANDPINFHDQKNKATLLPAFLHF